MLLLNNSGINPDKNEIAYDSIDQNCDGKDLTDVDNDGFDSDQVNGDDCDDNNAGINPNAVELLDNIDQNCRNDKPILFNTIPGITFNEDKKKHTPKIRISQTPSSFK